MRFFSFGGILVVGIASTLKAGVISVPADYGTIQDAINAAAEGDTIVVSPGTYVEHINFLGKAIVVQSTNLLNPGATTIDAGGAGVAVKFETGEGAGSTLAGFTLTNGNAPAGGGVRVGASANPSIQHCQFEGNLSNFG